ncbi:MAG: hypothetical protein ABSF60_14990 [Verrucomicrobiota bacterium]
MNEPLSEPGRKQLPHLPSLELSNQTVIQYVSCNVEGRRSLLANPEIHQLLIETWRKANHWLVGRYVVMPDHVHFFCAPAHVPVTPLKRWMEFWRAEATRRWPCAGDKPIWQFFLTGNFAAVRVIIRNGSILWRTPSRPVWWRAGKIGHIKVN